jgi:hypothetical protein
MRAGYFQPSVHCPGLANSGLLWICTAVENLLFEAVHLCPLVRPLSEPNSARRQNNHWTSEVRASASVVEGEALDEALS